VKRGCSEEKKFLREGDDPIHRVLQIGHKRKRLRKKGGGQMAHEPQLKKKLP